MCSKQALREECNRCLHNGSDPSFRREVESPQIVFIVDPMEQDSFLQGFFDRAFAEIPPTYRRVRYSIIPLLPCKTNKVSACTYRTCDGAAKLSDKVLTVLCGKTVQRIILGHSPNQKISSGCIVDKDGYTVALLPGVQDIFEAEIEDRDDWFNVFTGGMRKLLTSTGMKKA